MRIAHAWRAWISMCGLAAVCAAPAMAIAQDDAEKEAAPRIEIRGFGEGGVGGGGFGGIALPKEFEAMMKAAQEVAELQAKYQSSVDDLIAAAKELDQAENLMDSVTKVAKLAKQSEELKAQITKKQEEMTKKIGGGAIGFGAFGIGGGVGGAGEGVKILPAPRVEFKVEGLQLEVAPEKAPVDEKADEE